MSLLVVMMEIDNGQRQYIDENSKLMAHYVRHLPDFTGLVYAS